MKRIERHRDLYRIATRVMTAATIGSALGLLVSANSLAGPPTSLGECILHGINYCNGQHPVGSEAWSNCKINMTNHCYDVFGGGSGYIGEVRHGTDYSTEQPGGGPYGPKSPPRLRRP